MMTFYFFNFCYGFIEEITADIFEVYWQHEYEAVSARLRKENQ